MLFVRLDLDVLMYGLLTSCCFHIGTLFHSQIKLVHLFKRADLLALCNLQFDNRTLQINSDDAVLFWVLVRNYISDL